MKTLDSFCHSNSFLRTKVALLTFHNIRYSNYTERILILFEYLQLISQILFLHVTVSDYAQEHSKNTVFFSFILYFFKLVNPSYLMPLHTYNALSQVLLVVVFCCMMLKYILFCYISAICYYDLKCSSLLLFLWRWTFKLQSRVLCFFMTSFWVKVILGCSADTFSIQGIDKSVIIGISGALIAIEYAFSFSLETQFSYVLPKQNYLASKDYKTQIATLIQKLFLQILLISIDSSSPALLWTSSVFNLILGSFKSHHVYKALPLYNIKALLDQGDLLSIVLSLNMTCFVFNILKSADYEGAIKFLIVAWIPISFLVIKAYRQLLEMRLLSLLNSPAEVTPEFAIHKLAAHRQIKKMLKVPSQRTKKVPYSYLLSSIIKKSAKDIFNLSGEYFPTSKVDSISDRMESEFYQEYLANLAKKFPGNSLINLYLAYLCSKDPSSYMKAIKIISSFKEKTWSQSYLSSMILLYELEKVKLANQFQKDTQQLDILSYLQSHTIVEELRNNMLHQTDLKMTICNNILDPAPNIGQIYNCSQKIDVLIRQTKKKISQLYSGIPDSFIEPLLLIARYHLVLGYSIDDYQKYNALYFQKHTKYDRSFKELNFSKDNLYQESNVFLIMSGEKNQSGQIVYTTHSIENLCGKKQASYKGAHISSLFTSIYQAFYLDVLKSCFEIGEKNLLDRVQRAFICHKDGYVVETELYFKIHPYISCGLNLDVMIRSVPSSGKQYLLVKEDGNIEGATKAIADILYLKAGSQPSPVLLNIRQVSEELWRMNLAFNRVMKVQKKEKRGSQKVKGHPGRYDFVDPEDYKEALELYKLYSKSSKKVLLMNTRQALRRLNTLGKNDQNNVYCYNCSVSLFQFGDSYLKLVALEKVDQEEEQSEGKSEDSDLLNCHDDDSLFGSENIDSPERASSLEIASSPTGHREFTTCANLVQTQRSQVETKTTQTQRANQKSKLLGYYGSKREFENIENSESQRIKRLEIEASSIMFNNNHDKLIYKTFQSAVAKDFWPKSFNTLCIVFYAVILITFFSQVILKVVSDNTMKALSIKKNLLMYSQLRTYKILLIDVNARGAINNIIDTTVDKGETDGGVAIVITNLKGHEKDLISYNQAIINGVNYLDDEIKRKIYARDINVVGSYVDNSTSTERNISNFEMIDEFIDTIHKLFSFINADPSESIPYFEFLVKNSLGDFLHKCQEITNLFTNSVDLEKGYLRDTITLCLVITPLLLFGVILTMTYIIVRQYKVEKNQMFAFIKLNPEKVKNILLRLKKFKKNLEEQDYSGHIDAFPTGKIPEGNFRKKFDISKINCAETRFRYVKYTLRVTAYILILIAIMLWNYLSALSSVNVIYRRQNQLEFANKLSESVSVSNSAQAELFSSNNTTPIKYMDPSGMSPSELIEAALIDITDLQSQVPEVFREEDRSYNPQIEAMIFTNTMCSQYNLHVELYIYFCNVLVNSGQNINLISLLAFYRSLLQGRNPDYEACDLTNMTRILECGYSNNDYFLPTFALVAAEAQLMGDLISRNIETNISEVYNERKVFLVVFSFSLVGVSFMLWFQILKKLRNSNNNFKKVLNVFPPNLILSSFLLKTFLMQHSKEIENIRNTKSMKSEVNEQQS